MCCIPIDEPTPPPYKHGLPPCVDIWADAEIQIIDPEDFYVDPLTNRAIPEWGTVPIQRMALEAMRLRFGKPNEPGEDGVP